MSRYDIKIKHCFWFKKGKCTSPELYRFHPDCEETGDCPFYPELTAFTEKPEGLRCLEFRRAERT